MIALRILLTGLVIALLTTVVAWRAPVSWWLPEETGGIVIAPVGNSSLGRGEALLDLSGLPGYSAKPGPLRVEWQWCPEHDFSSWCVRASGEQLAVSTRVSGFPVTLEEISIEELGARWLTPHAPGLVDFRIAGAVTRVEIGDLRCPSRRIETGGGDLRVGSVILAGRAMHDHRIEIENGPGLIARLSGIDATGSLQLDANRFAWELLWYPQSGAAVGLLPPGAASSGPIRLTEEGAISC